jgi:hypothetical protein
LAQEIKLDDDEYNLWAQVKGGGDVSDPPTPGTIYTVPNTVIVDLGPRRPGLLGWWLDSEVVPKMHERAEADADRYRSEGFKVETHNWAGKTPSGAVNPIQEHLMNPNLHAYGYGGHGGHRGILTYAFREGQKYTILAGRYSHHRLAELWLYSCYSLEWNGVGDIRYDPKSLGGRTGWNWSDWELNVSRYGSLHGFAGNAYPHTEPITRWGGLREKSPRAPEPPIAPTHEDFSWFD